MGKRTTLFAVLILVAGGLVIWRLQRFSSVPAGPVMVQGAVMVRSDDVDKQAPIPGVSVSVEGLPDQTVSTSTGFFGLNLGNRVKPAQPIVLEFRHPQYQPLDLTVFAGVRIDLARMVPVSESRAATASATTAPHTVMSGIAIRYTTKTTTNLNVGSEVKTFNVANTANVPCNGRYLCSPDGKWKASIGSASLQAPAGNFFANARVGCIAGPCAFTKIRFDGFSHGGPSIRVDVLGWASTTTFLFEAEVFRTMVSDAVIRSYPVIFAGTLHFTVPPEADGLCIEADVNGAAVVFPLGPQPFLDWATCTESINPDRAQVYQCQLKSGYSFK